MPQLTGIGQVSHDWIVVYDNSSLGFVNIEQKVEGLLDTYTDLKNPNFAAVAQAIGLWGKRVEHPGEVEAAVAEWLAVPGLALLDVVVTRNELVLPPKVETKQVLGMALYSAKGILSGGDRARGVLEMLGDALKR